MDNKVRRFWSGRLHPGDIIIYRGVRCRVANDYQFSKKVNVPSGCVPIFYDVNLKVGPVFTIPFDDVDEVKRA